MSRIVEGWIAVAQEEQQDIRGKTIFEVKTPLDKARAIIAGPWTLPQARARWRREKFDILPDAVWKNALAKGIIETIPVVADLIGKNPPSESKTRRRVKKMREEAAEEKSPAKARALKIEANTILRKWNVDHPKNKIRKP